MSLKAEREALKSTLTSAGVNAFASVPARFIPPAAIVVPGSPYLESGDTFNRAAIRYDVWLAAPSGALAESQLDDLIDAAVAKLYDADFDVESVSQPFDWAPTSGGTHLTAIVSIRGSIPYPA